MDMLAAVDLTRFHIQKDTFFFFLVVHLSDLATGLQCLARSVCFPVNAGKILNPNDPEVKIWIFLEQWKQLFPDVTKGEPCICASNPPEGRLRL